MTRIEQRSADRAASSARHSESETPTAIHDAPWQADQEWANALTHGIAALGSVVLGAHLVFAALTKQQGLAVACAAYSASVFGTFFFSTMSHVIRRQPLLNTLRAYDQAMIYMMISGTYTPIIFQYASESHRNPLLWAIWIAAWMGFLKKVAFRYRINSIGTYTYLLLGWLPSIPLASQVPSDLVWWMLCGGVLYTIGVVFLMNDRKLPYLHAGWHLCVMIAAACHYYAILRYVVQ